MQFRDDDLDAGDPDYDYIRPQGVIYETLPAGPEEGAVGGHSPTSPKSPKEVHPGLKECQVTKIIMPEVREKLDQTLFPPPYADYNKAMKLKDSKIVERKMKALKAKEPDAKNFVPGPPVPKRKPKSESIRKKVLPPKSDYENQKQKKAEVPPIPRKPDFVSGKQAQKQVAEPKDEDSDYEPVNFALLPLPPVPAKRIYFKTLQDVPADISLLSVKQVACLLSLLKLDKYIDKFACEDMDGALLLYQDEECLMQAFDMNKYEARKLITFVKKEWRPNVDED